MTIKEAKEFAFVQLSRAGIDDAEFDSFELIQKVTGLNRTGFFLKQDEVLSEETFAELCDLVNRRIDGTPLQYLIGEWEFFGLPFRVGEGVLIPRPETEELVEIVLEYLRKEERFNGEKRAKVLDLCAGTGCIGISIASSFEHCDVLAIEKSEKAFEYAKQNALLNGTANYAVNLGDICDLATVADYDPVDVLVSNPPYIPLEQMDGLQKEVKNEPFMALCGGEDGLDFYRAIAELWMPLVKPHGMLIVEIGEDQGSSALGIFKGKCENAQIIRDVFGNDRLILCNIH